MHGLTWASSSAGIDSRLKWIMQLTWPIMKNQADSSSIIIYSVVDLAWGRIYSTSVGIKLIALVVLIR